MLRGKSWFRCARCVAVLLGLVGFTCAANGQTSDWYVKANAVWPFDGSYDHPFQTFAQALNNLALEDGDIIEVFDGTYDGPDNRDLPVSGNILIKSTNGPENCIIDCQGGPSPGNWHRAFNITAVPGKHVEIEGFTIINGCHTTGAAIYAEMFVVGSPAIYDTIRNCRFENNDAYTGLC